LAFLLSGTDSFLTPPQSTGNASNTLHGSLGPVINDELGKEHRGDHSDDAVIDLTDELLSSNKPSKPIRKKQKDFPEMATDEDSAFVESVIRPVVVKRNWTNAHGQSVVDGRSRSSQVRYADKARVPNVELSRRQYDESVNRRPSTRRPPSSTNKPDHLRDDKGQHESDLNRLKT
jgi:hypothetical protein